MKFIGGINGKHAPETRDIAGLLNAIEMGEFKKISKPRSKDYFKFHHGRGRNKRGRENVKAQLDLKALARRMDVRLNRP